MIYVGIDVAKHKHDCFIISSEGEVLHDSLRFENSREGFEGLYSTLLALEKNPSPDNMRIGLEATGHYSNNLVRFLSERKLNPVLLNPLSSDLYRKAQTLRKTKTDKTDARLIATMLISEDFKSYTPLSYHISEIKALTRHRFRLVGERSKLKVSLVRILDIVFPELASAVWSVHQKSMLILLAECPGANAVAACHLTRLTSLLQKASHGKYSREKALELRELARTSIGTGSAALSFELRQTIQHIRFLQEQIDMLDKEIKAAMIQLDSPILTVPGISYVLAATILAEIGDINAFSDAGKLLAFAGLEPSTYQSGQYNASHTRMVKRGSKYLRWALLTAARLVCMRDVTFAAFYAKKKAEGKHHYVALSHVARKLVRVIFYMLQKDRVFVPQAS